MLAHQCYRWVRWFVLDHALLVALVLMVAAILSLVLYRSNSDLARTSYHLQRSVDDRL